jgi:hypothetical protein
MSLTRELPPETSERGSGMPCGFGCCTSAGRVRLIASREAPDAMVQWIVECDGSEGCRRCRADSTVWVEAAQVARFSIEQPSLLREEVAAQPRELLGRSAGSSTDVRHPIQIPGPPSRSRSDHRARENGRESRSLAHSESEWVLDRETARRHVSALSAPQSSRATGSRDPYGFETPAQLVRRELTVPFDLDIVGNLSGDVAPQCGPVRPARRDGTEVVHGIESKLEFHADDRRCCGVISHL